MSSPHVHSARAHVHCQKYKYTVMCSKALRRRKTNGPTTFDNRLERRTMHPNCRSTGTTLRWALRDDIGVEVRTSSRPEHLISMISPNMFPPSIQLSRPRAAFLCHARTRRVISVLASQSQPYWIIHTLRRISREAVFCISNVARWRVPPVLLKPVIRLSSTLCGLITICAMPSF
ncbi:hypothetical protein BC629DRAFT_225778 [Irpex lacteus]|nr:hypothetical protein BC629DRAFT_225778 [Irpex lacteus]